jgi:hypothetical protein
LQRSQALISQVCCFSAEPDFVFAGGSLLLNAQVGRSDVKQKRFDELKQGLSLYSASAARLL